MTNDLLRWIERGLIAIGVVLAVWCAAVLIEARFTNALPIPRSAPTAASRSLPGDATTAAAPAAPGPTATTGTIAPPPGSWLARLAAPELHLSATVLEGTDDATLRRGAGHIEDTAFPGQPGNVGIAGHRDTIFRAVRKIHIGDALTLTTADRVYTYRVAKTSIVQPEDVYVLDPTDHSTLTLVTCYPFEFIGHAPKRFIVSADLVGQGPVSASNNH